MRPHSATYSPITNLQGNGVYSGDTYPEKEFSTETDERRLHRTRLSAQILLQLASLLFALSVIFFVGAISKKPSHQECTRQVSIYCRNLALPIQPIIHKSWDGNSACSLICRVWGAWLRELFCAPNQVSRTANSWIRRGVEEIVAMYTSQPACFRSFWTLKLIFDQMATSTSQRETLFT